MGDRCDTGEEIGQQKYGEPMFLFKLVVCFPLISFVIALCVHLGLIGLTVGLYIKGENVFAADFQNLPLWLNDESSHLRDLAWRGRNDFNDSLQRIIISRKKPWWLRGYAVDYLELIYETENDNILTNQHLRTIKSIESNITEGRNYSVDLCQLQYDQTCVKPTSVLRFFDGTFEKIDPAFRDPNFDNIPQVLSKASYYNETRPLVKLLIASESHISELGIRVGVIRTRLPLGGPLSYDASRASQEAIYEQFYLDILQPYLDRTRQSTGNGMKFYYIGKQLFLNDLRKQAERDLMLGIGSLSFIFLYMWAHTASFWITFWSTFSIVSSFLATNLFYRYVLQYEYFGLFHILSVFIILGIGADDIFIFFDTWRLNCKNSFPTNAHRFAATYRKSVGAMFVTSLTTAVAFLVSGLSPLLAVSSFGIFSGLLVIINYLSVITFFPTVVVVYSLRILPMIDGCLKQMENVLESHENAGFEVNETNDKHSSMDGEGLELPNGAITDILGGLTSEQPLTTVNVVSTEFDYSSPNSNEPECAKMEDELSNGYFISSTHSVMPVDSETGNCNEDQSLNHGSLLYIISRFLENQYFWFITRKPVKIVTPLLFLVLVVVFAVFASRLRPDEKQVQMFRASHNYGRARHLQNYAFGANDDDDLTRVHMVWGLKDRNLRLCNFKSSKECNGDNVFDEHFSFSTADDQRALLKVCKHLKSLSDAEVDALRIKRDMFTNKPEVACFMDAIQQFFWKEKDKHNWREKRVYPENVTFDLPLSDEDYHIFLAKRLALFQGANEEILNRRIELAIAYWMTNGWTLVATDDYFLYGGLIGEKIINKSTSAPQHPALSFGAVIKYIGIEFNTTMYVNTLGYEEGLPVYEKWEQLMKDVLKYMPDHLNQAFQSTKHTWHWLKVQQSLANSAIFGIIIGLSLALPILVLTTLNVIIGFLATLIISLITVCVVGMIHMEGWRLGVLESLNLCLVVGLSVDYVVHLAEAYHRCPYGDRERRVKHMLGAVGTSVLSGAITTFGASIFMLFAQIQFLFQFGIFILSTIGFSILFALLGFTVLLVICGPQHNTGSIVALFKRFVPSRFREVSLSVLEERPQRNSTNCQNKSCDAIPSGSQLPGGVQDKYTHNSNHM